MAERRVNPWPVGILLVYGAFVGVLAGFVAWSVRQRDDLVAPDYYARELVYQQEIDALERALPYAGQLTWRPGAGTLELVVADPLRGLLADGVLQFYRPSDAALDRRLPLTLDPGGRFTVDTSAMAPGFWRTRVEWRHDGQDYALESTVNL